MKKVLEDELLSLAHRILKLKNRADIHQLKKEAGVLYEKLSVLSFAETHFGGIRPTIGKQEFTDAYFEQYEDYDDEGSYKHPDGTEYNSDPISEPNTEKIKDIVSQMPPEAEQVDYLLEQFQKLTQMDFSELQQQTTDHKTTPEEDSTEEKNSDKDQSEEINQITNANNKALDETSKNEISAEETPLDDTETSAETSTKSDDISAEKNNLKPSEEDFGVHYDDLPDFEPKAPEPKFEEKTTPTETEANYLESSKSDQGTTNSDVTDHPNDQSKLADKDEGVFKPKQRTSDLFPKEKKSLNDQLQKGVKIGLNDRLAFTKQLFDGKVEEYNRVLSQVDTLSSFDNAQQFIEQTVKPEYPNWDNKTEVYERFLEIIQRKFEA